MKNWCSRIVHPGTNHIVSFTDTQHLNTQKNTLPVRDCLVQIEDLVGLENLLTAIYVSSVLKKQMQKTILSRNYHLPKINDKAVKLGEDYILALLAEGDLVAIEAKYHLKCYTMFNRCYNVICKQTTVSENLEITAENELLHIVSIKEEIRGGSRVFDLQDLTEIMTERLEQYGIQKIVNRTRLKETVLKNFLDLTEEKGIRDRVFIMCSKTARKIISDITNTRWRSAHITNGSFNPQNRSFESWNSI